MPITFAGMSIRGKALPITEYWLTGFEFPWPGVVPKGLRRRRYSQRQCGRNSLPPSRSLYLTVLPPPEMTPSVTVRLEAGTPSCVDAMFSSVVFASAAAAPDRRRAARDATAAATAADCLQPALDVSEDIWFMFMFISSATIIRTPVGVP